MTMLVNQLTVIINVIKDLKSNMNTNKDRNGRYLKTRTSRAEKYSAQNENFTG